MGGQRPPKYHFSWPCQPSRSSHPHPHRTPHGIECCPDVNFGKYIIFFHRFACLFAGGIAVLGVGIWTVSEKHKYVALLTTGTYQSVAYILLLAGCTVIVAVCLGCCALRNEDRCTLMLYTFLLLLVFLLEAIGGVLAYIYEEQVMAELSLRLTDTFNDGYMVDEAVTQAVDDMQLEYKCCGALSFQEWSDSIWVESNPTMNNTVPDSCCKTPSPYCGVRDHPSNVWYTGCIHRFEDELGRHLVVLGAVGCGLSLIQVIGMILSCCLYVKLKDIEDQYK
ncbi:unnamed protein product, partial [Meganyctiphanes norvegica]